MERILEQIRDFADAAHGEQTRKYTPDRYIVHPVRVMEICKEYTQDICILGAALLHDVVEDTPVGLNDIRKFLTEVMESEQQVLRTVALVEDLTDIYVKSAYPQWNRRKRKAKEAERMEKSSPEAQTVKYADIIDNSVEIVQFETDFAPLFLFECRSLLKRIPRGHPRLYQRAVKTVDECIEKVKR